jgi:hypothetical protein
MREPYSARVWIRDLLDSLPAGKSVCAAGLLLLSQAGCGREFFRQWADQDVSEAIFEKSRDPRWELPTFTIEPPPLSRFADPYDEDRPPAPPDDRAAEALSPTPQWSHHKLLTPVEGAGYIDLLDSGPRYQPPPGALPTGVDLLPDNQPPLPDPNMGPFTPPAQPLDDPLQGVPPAEPIPPPPPPAIPNGEPPQSPNNPQTRASRPKPGVYPLQSTSQGRRAEKDRQVARTVSTQTKASVATHAPPKPNRANSSSKPAHDPAVRRAAHQDPPVNPPVDPGQERMPIDLDRPPQDRPVTGDEPLPAMPDDPQEREREARRRVAGFASILVPGAIDFNESEAAGLPANARPYIINPAQALQLALINSRAYQFRLENIYQASLTVTLNRFQFEPQGVIGMTPQTAPAGGLFTNPVNQFLYSTFESPSGQSSRLNLGTVAGMGKVFMFGGRLATGFANQTIFNFVGANPRQPEVQSTLPLTIVQPFLAGGGRAVTLEPLTLAERNLLYEVRSFARFRQTFIPNVLTSGLPLDNPGQGDGATGYLQVLQNVLQVENNRRLVAAFEQILKVYREYARNAASGISRMQVDQVEQNLQGARQNLVQSEFTYRNNLDLFKIQLGLPPDVPLILDRTATAGIRSVFNELDLWLASPEHDPVDLPGIINKMPRLESIEIDGRPLFKYEGEEVVLEYGEASRIEEICLAAERVALENRLELMNQRAQLYDSWRQYAVTANALKGIFNVTLTNQIFTPNNTTNPFAFVDNSKQFSLAFNAELPLIRVQQRNAYVTAKIQYRRQRTLLQQQEDLIKFSVRQELRQLVNQVVQYEVQKRNILYTIRSRDATLQQIVAPPAAAGADQTSQTINLVGFTNQVNQLQNQLVQIWVTYQSQRLALYRDLGILPYDEWEAYYEFFPADTAGNGGASSRIDGGPPAGGAVDPQPAPVGP